MHNGVSYFRQVVLVIPGIAGGNTGTQFTFTDQPDIRYARIQSIESYFSSDLSNTYPQPVAVLTDSLANKVSLIMETNDPDDITHMKGSNGRFQGTLQTIKGLPLTAIHRMQNQATNNASFVRMNYPFKDEYITWEKSFVNIAPGGLSNEEDVAIVLGVWYTFINKEGKEIQRT